MYLSRFILCTSFITTLVGQVEVDMVLPATALPNGDPKYADLDGDGDLDLVFGPGSLSYTNPHLYWMENNGNRQFSELKLVHLALMPEDTVWRSSDPLNFDADDDREFLIDVQTPSGWSSGKPLPTHQPFLYDPVTGMAPTGLLEPDVNPWYAVDLDNDGQAEIVQFRGKWDESWVFHIFRRQPDGEFAMTVEIPLVTNRLELDPVARLEVIDLDDDGDLDLSLQFDYGYHVILKRTGVDSFEPTPVVVEATDLNARWADLDGDGRKDLLTWNFGWMKNLGNLSFELQPRVPAADIIYIDSRLPHVVDRPGESALLHGYLITESYDYEIFRTPFDSTEIALTQRLTFDDDVFQTNRYPTDWVDLDGDGFQDLIFRTGRTYAGGESIAVAWGGEDSFSAVISLRTDIVDPVPIVADFNADGFPDLIVGPDLDGVFRLSLNNGKGGFPEFRKLDELHQTVNGVSIAPQAMIGAPDLNGDDVVDLVVDYSRSDTAGRITAVAWLVGRGDGTFERLSAPPEPLMGLVPGLLGSSSAEFSDWDQDGDLDLITFGSWIENDDGLFRVGNASLIALGQGTDFLGNPFPMGFTVTGDLDGDGYSDIVSAVRGVLDLGSIPPSSEALYMTVGFNDGSGGIAEFVDLPDVLAGFDLLGNPGVYGEVRIIDVDSDGLPDLCTRVIDGYDLIGSPTITGRWRKNPGQGARDLSTWEVKELPEGPIPARHEADFDGDGIDEWVEFTYYVESTPGGPLRSQDFDFVGNADLSSYATQVIKDFDGDGDADFLLGGNGYNPLLLLRNPLVDHHDPLVARMAEAGIPGALGGMSQDADGDGRDNFTELTEGTNPIEWDHPSSNPYQLNLSTGSGVAILAYRIPWRANGLGGVMDPVPLSDLGISFSVEASRNLLNWRRADESPEVIIFSDGLWNYVGRGFIQEDSAGFFRLRVEHSPGG